MSQAKALYDFEGSDKSELTIHVGDIIKVTNKVNKDARLNTVELNHASGGRWLVGRRAEGQEGTLPCQLRGRNEL